MYENVKFNSKIVIGDMTYYIKKKFNWFNRLMIRLVFGIKIEKVKYDN